METNKPKKNQTSTAQSAQMAMFLLKKKPELNGLNHTMIGTALKDKFGYIPCNNTIRSLCEAVGITIQSGIHSPNTQRASKKYEVLKNKIDALFEAFVSVTENPAPMNIKMELSKLRAEFRSEDDEQ